MAWTTPIDRVFNQKAFFYTFVGIIVGTAALTLFSDSPIGKPDVRKKDIVFDPSSRDPQNWSINDLKRWLQQRDIHFEPLELRDDLIKRVQEAMEASKRREHVDTAEIQRGINAARTDDIELNELGKDKRTAK